MEQFLVDKMKSNNMDEIDKDMIVMRCTNASYELHELANKFWKDVGELCEKYETEFKIIDMGIVCGITDAAEDHLGCKILFGTSKSVLKCIKELSEDALGEFLEEAKE